MRWLLVVLLTAVPAMAEEITTANVLPPLSGFTTSGSTNATGGTGNASNGGGTYTSTFDVPLTEAEVQRGFSMDTSVTVDSHSSNGRLDTCVSITQTSDCRDIFSVGITLFEAGDVAWKFSREIELDFGGSHDYTFTDTVGENNFGVLTASLWLYGIDAGYHGGMYGPVFSDPSMTFTYQDVVEQQVLEQIAQLDVEVAITLPPPITIEPISAPAESPPPQPVQTFTALAPTAPVAPPPPPTIEQIQPEPQEQQQEAEVEAAIEMEMQTQPEPQPEPEQQAEAEPEPEAEPEQQAEAEPEAEPEQQQAEAEPEPEAEPEQQQAEAEPEPQTKQEKQKAAAERVVKKIAPSQRYSAASQATTMVVMNMLAGKIATDAAMIDTQGFFPATGMNDDRSMSNPLQDYTMFGGSNAAHDRLMQTEWNR